MKESTKKYIIEKVKMFADVEVHGNRVYENEDRFSQGINYDLFWFLEKAVSKMSQKEGWSFVSFFLYPDDGQYGAELSASLPVDLSVNGGKDGEEAVYVHMLNSNLGEDIVEAIGNIRNIAGEICVSDIGDDQFSVRKTKIGLLFQGKPSRTFECDCWSYTKADGTRYATRLESYSNRNESWLVPAKSKILAVVYNDRSYELALKVADIYGLDLIPYSAINSSSS